MSAIVSDYDGTLCPVGGAESRNTIPNDLESILSKIASRVPVCILSRSDYSSLRDMVPFAGIISCMLGIETLVLDKAQSIMGSKIKACDFLLERDRIRNNSYALDQLAQEVNMEFLDINIGRRFTHDGLLASISFDWRHYKDIKACSKTVTQYVKGKMASMSSGPFSDLFMQTYDSHPFIDVHTVKCDKGQGFDRIVTRLNHNSITDEILYFGDSESDNPAFRKAGISVGIHSDTTSNPKLDCQYLIKYHNLIPFLDRLECNNFEFREELLFA